MDSGVVEDHEIDDQRDVAQSHLEPAAPVGDVLVRVFAKDESLDAAPEEGDAEQDGEDRNAPQRQPDKATEIFYCAAPE